MCQVFFKIKKYISPNAVLEQSSVLFCSADYVALIKRTFDLSLSEY